MDERRWERLAPLTGILAVVLWVVGMILLFKDDPANEPPEQIASHFAEHDTRLLLGAFIFMVGAASFLWFVGTLRAALARAEDGVSRLAGIAFGGGIVTASMLFAMVAPIAAGAVQAQNEDRDPSPQAADALWHLGNGFLIGAEVAAIVLVTATALVVLRTGVLPRWLAWVSLVLALWLLIGPIGWLGLLFGVPIWTLLVSILLSMRAADPSRGERAFEAVT